MYVVVEGLDGPLCYLKCDNKESARTMAIEYRRIIGDDNKIIIKLLTREDWKLWYMNSL